ncbi:hypothetical protein GCM10027037_13720 [Mucilaginibacter koreensis]
MDFIKFVEEFNRIKPDVSELIDIDPTISTEVVNELIHDYDLQIICIKESEDPLFNLISNTNICNLYFCSIIFSNDFQTDEELVKIGYCVEKADIYLDCKTNTVTFLSFKEYLRFETNAVIPSNEFVEFLLKYLEIYFNKTFRKNGEQRYIHQITTTAELKTNYLFNILLEELEI